ncbi:MAG: PAS domain-containing protein [Alphaproteobacteria bacterium]|nr:PAS domain-containing protein [Alphaproteobacteria bacterium]MBL6952434.1 PAS domain-containing protein [Alphaproteobacteria bacterium]
MEFHAPEVRRWVNYWLALQGEDLVPLRSRLDPAGLPALLPYVSIFDRSEPGVARLRLVGTDTVARTGFDATGTDYLDAVEPKRRASALQGYLVPANHPCGMRVVVVFSYATGHRTLIEAAGFPFERDDGAGRQMVFVSVELDAKAAYLRGKLDSLDLVDLETREFIDIGAGVPG